MPRGLPLPMIIREAHLVGIVHADSGETAKGQWRDWMMQVLKGMEIGGGRTLPCMMDSIEVTEKDDGVYYCAGRLHFEMRPGGM